MKTILRNVWLAVLPALVIPSVSGAGLVNGSFETPTFPVSIISYTPAPGSDPAPPDFGWTVVTGDINALTSAYWQPSEGSQSIELNGETTASIYQVQYRSDLTANTWMDLLGTNVTGTGARLCVPDRVSVDHPRRFYRVTRLE